jgi:hypothetical protein
MIVELSGAPHIALPQEQLDILAKNSGLTSVSGAYLHGVRLVDDAIKLSDPDDKMPAEVKLYVLTNKITWAPPPNVLALPLETSETEVNDRIVFVSAIDSSLSAALTCGVRVKIGDI